MAQVNDVLAGRPPTMPGQDLSLLDPPIIPQILPVPTRPGLREPAVATAAHTWDEYQLVPSNPIRSVDTDNTPYGLIAYEARRGLGPYPQARSRLSRTRLDQSA